MHWANSWSSDDGGARKIWLEPSLSPRVIHSVHPQGRISLGLESSASEQSTIRLYYQKESMLLYFVQARWWIRTVRRCMSRFSLLRYDDNLESAETNLLVGWHWIEKEKERKKKSSTVQCGDFKSWFYKLTSGCDWRFWYDGCRRLGKVGTYLGRYLVSNRPTYLPIAHIYLHKQDAADIGILIR